MASVYSKILRIPSVGTESSNLTSGHVTNLASNDVERFVATAVTANFIVLGPLEALLILVLGVYIIGPVFCAGYGLLCLLVPLQFWLGNRFATLRALIAKETDARVGWISQAVHGARIMKQSGFETMFLDRITCQRRREIQQLQTTSRLKALNEAIYFFSSVIVASFVYCVYVAVDGRLTPEIVYTTLTLLNILQFTLTKHIPNAIMGLSECYVSCQRLQALLDLPEANLLGVGDCVNATTTADVEAVNKPILSLSAVTCHWDSSTSDRSQGLNKIALSDISLTFQPGKLYCVIGRIGSSKSALLQALSGELPATSGSIQRTTNLIGYAAQESWIMNGTIRENILMGLNFDPERYNMVIEACALRHDLDHFSNGDETIVGDRGIQISGGQKARIGLARVFYKPHTDLLLLDDPLSACDANTAKTIFFSAIQRLGVQRQKCVVLVTHQHQFVGMADHCILMDQGTVACVGTFEDCRASATVSTNNEIQIVEAHDTEEETEESFGNELPAKSAKESQEEKRVTGIVKTDTWNAYAKAIGGYPVCAFFFAIFVMSQATLLLTLLLMGRWGELAQEEQHSARWFAVVGGMTATLVLLTIFRAQASFFILINGSRKLHDEMTTAVLRAKMSFFDTNPLGRILNRFSADVGIVDETLPCTCWKACYYYFFRGVLHILTPSLSDHL